MSNTDVDPRAIESAPLDREGVRVKAVVRSIHIVPKVDRHVREGANIAVVENKLDIDFARVEVKPHLFLELYHLYGVCVCMYV